MPDNTQPIPGIKPGRYQIFDILGQGGSGRVYRGYDTQEKRWVAFKRFFPPKVIGSTQKPFAARDPLPCWQQQNLVKYYEAGMDDEGPFLTMELVKGRTLRVAIEEMQLSLENYLPLAQQTLEGCAMAHSCGYLHGDLNPENIMLGPHEEGSFLVKLLDFRLLPRTLNSVPDHSIFGAIHTVAPEQFQQKPLDARTDLYALGCCLYYACTGRQPFDGPTEAEIMLNHLNHKVQPIQEVNPELPSSLASLIMKLISRQPEDRPSSAEEALQSIKSGP
jgi:serine/threonine protein kinase